MTSAVALLGEIEEDPSVLGFDLLQTRLAEVAAEINRDHAADLVVPFTAGGTFPEFAAVLRDLGAAYPLARALAEAFHPLGVRVGAVLGPVALPPQDPPPTLDQMEGAAFDQAAELLYHARKEHRLLVLRGAGPPTDRLANALILMLYRDLRQWTSRQCEVVRLYRRHRRQHAVAEALGVTQQSVSSSLASAGWKMLEEAEGSLLDVLSRVRSGALPSVSSEAPAPPLPPAGDV